MDKTIGLILGAFLLLASFSANYASAQEVYQRTVTLLELEINESLQEINLDIYRGMLNTAQISFRNGRQLSLSVQVASDDLESIHELAASVETHSRPVSLGVTSTQNFSCQIQSQNGRISGVNGLCVQQINIVLPNTFDGKLYLGASLIFSRDYALSDLLVDLGRADLFSNQKLEKIIQYAAQLRMNRATITILEICQIMDLFTFAFDNQKIEAIEAFAGLVADKRNATIVARYFFDQSMKNRVVSALQR